MKINQRSKIKYQIFLRLIIVIFLVSFLTLNVKPSHAIYESYINTIQPNAQITSETQTIQQELEKEVQEVVSGGHWAPTQYWVGGASTFQGSLIFYATPLDVIYTLSAAYPYLSPTLQTSVRTYLQSEISTYPPHSTGYYQPNAGTIGQWVGSRHEYYPIKTDQAFNYWPGPPVHISILYPIWLYSNNIDGGTYARNNYAAIKSIYTNFKTSSNSTITSYPQLAGVLGFARIAKQLNFTADYNDAVAFAEQGFAAGLNFDQFLATATTNFPPGTLGGQRYAPPIFVTHRPNQNTTNPISLHFNRDIGKFIKDNVSTKNQANIHADKINKDVPLAWMTGAGMTWGENLYTTPDIPWTYFMLKSYTQGESVVNLKKILDLPDRKADFFYIQKLVAIIESPSSGTTPTTPLPSPTIAKMYGNANGDSKVNLLDYNILVTEFLQSGTNLAADFNNSGKVDYGDYNILVTYYAP